MSLKAKKSLIIKEKVRQVIHTLNQPDVAAIMISLQSPTNYTSLLSINSDLLSRNATSNDRK